MRWRLIATMMAIGAVLAPIFNLLSVEVSWGPALQGLIDGLLIAFIAGVYIMFVRDGSWRPFLQRRRFVVRLLINAGMYLLLFQGGRLIGNLITRPALSTIPETLFTAQIAVGFPFFLGVALIIEFILEMNRMVGTNVLCYFVTGAYRRPVEEERIFMFLDLEGSTRLAEELGSARYHELLQRFVDGLSDPILESGGEIYQYAGDEVIVSWKAERGQRNADCLRCYFGIEDAIERQAVEYERDFGERPRFRAGIHGGTVTAGELGDIKLDIVFVGDVLNTAARLEEYCKEHDHRFVASDAVVDRVELPSDLGAVPLGTFRPRGKEEELGVYSITRSS